MNSQSSTQRILIISVSAGAGHVRIAQAIEQTAHALYPDTTMMHIDMMEYVAAPLRKAIVHTYDVLVKTLPSVWGYIYDVSNSKKKLKRLEHIVKAVNQLQVKKFYEFVQEYNPTHIICTHSFPAQVLKHHKQFRDIPLSLVVTDYGIHSYWLLSESAQYFVGWEKMKEEMAFYGKDPNTIFATGIPVRPVFFTEKNVNKLKKNFLLPEDKKVVLLLSGGHGLMHADKIVDALTSVELSHDIVLIAVAGTNKKLKKDLDACQEKLPDYIELRVLGWVDNMDEYMRVADVVISKPGGSTTSECVALNKPMIIVDPIPGQEEQNTHYLTETQRGVVARSTFELYYYIEKLLQENKKPIIQDKKNAAEHILKHILNT